jgi:hypothetical protein
MLLQSYYLIHRLYSHFISCPNNLWVSLFFRSQDPLLISCQVSSLPAVSDTSPQACFVFQDPETCDPSRPIVLLPHRFRKRPPKSLPLTTVTKLSPPDPGDLPGPCKALNKQQEQIPL